MQPKHILTRYTDCGQIAAYVFSGSIEHDQIEAYFESQGGFFGYSYRGPGQTFTRCHVWQGAFRTIAYIECGLDI